MRNAIKFAASSTALSILLTVGATHALAHDADAIGAAAVMEGSPTLPKSSDASVERAARGMAVAAQNFWNGLSPELQAKAGFKFDNEERFNWHFIPRERKGITWNEMDAGQQALAHAFLASGLSNRGYQQAETIMSLDAVLKEMEKGKGPKRDPGNYAFSVFGTPGEKETWGWRVEGHHLSLNFTIVNGRAVAGPANVLQGPRKGLRVLAVEEDLGMDLIHSLSDDQKKAAIISDKSPNEIITSNSRRANPGPPVGIAESDLTPQQQKLLVTLIENYAYRLRPELADDDLARIDKAGLANVKLAWAGATEMGKGHYYRIQGPTFLVEFDNTQNNANHIHTVWRDPANDWGEDLLKEHYQSTTHGEHPDH
jgi:hypothetical protein